VHYERNGRKPEVPLPPAEKIKSHSQQEGRAPLERWSGGRRAIRREAPASAPSRFNARLCAIRQKFFFEPKFTEERVQKIGLQVKGLVLSALFAVFL